MTNLLSVSNLQVRFRIGRKFGVKRYLYAVDDISFAVKKGDTLGIVGESGSGKTTTALAVARLLEPYKGNALLEGQDLFALKANGLREIRRRIQFMFQDPYSSLNPRLRAAKVVREPLDHLTDKSKKEKDEIVTELFKQVGLRPEQKSLFPHQFSGGQRQRLGIARALATEPDLIICDEPVSALDVAVQSQILNLLNRLQQERELTYIFISHDLGVVQHICNRIAVMYMGKIVELADRTSLFSNPQHPYTEALLSAVPSINSKSEKRSRILLSGDAADTDVNQKGCRFAARCPIAIDTCREHTPELKEHGPNQTVACHRTEAGNESPLQRYYVRN